MATIDQRPARLDMYCAEGDDFTATFSVTENGSPWVSTGATVVTGILNRAGTAQVTNFTTAVSTGSLTLTLTDTQTTTLGAGVYRYYVQVTKSGVSRTWVAGGFTIAPDSGTGTSSSSASLSITTDTVTLSLTSLVAPNAQNISFTPSGSLSATDVQAAITEASTDLDAHLSDAVDAHDASAISVADTAGYYTGTDVEAVLAEQVGRFDALAGNKLVVTGDSITAADGDKTNNVFGNSWATHLALASDGVLQLAYNAAVGGYTTAQMLSAFDTEVIAKSPKIVGILAGTNDSLTGSQPTSTITNITAMVAKARGAGARVFLCTIPPAGNAALPTPSAPTTTVAATGGTLTAATYRYKVTMTNGAGETMVSAATDAVVASGSTNSVAVDVPFMEGATGYKVYKEWPVSSGTYLLAKTSSIYTDSLRWTDTGSVTPSGAVPGSNTTAVAWNTTYATKINTINSWIVRYGAANGIPVVDMYSQLVKASTGTYLDQYTTDGTHPTPTAQRRMGEYAWSVLSSWFNSGALPVTRDQLDPTNLYTNGCLINGSASLPTSWSSYGGSATGFTDTLAAKTGFAGQALTCARSTPEVRFHDSVSISTGFSAGDVIQISYMLQTENMEAGGGYMTITVRANGANADCGSLKLQAANVGPAVWTATFTVPASTTSLYLKGPYLAYGTGQVSIGQITWRNLTTMGIVSV